MTRYTVVWHKAAEDQLLRLWLTAADRQSIADAADNIDRELSHNASSKGIIVSDNMRELHVALLRVLFSVSEADRLVSIASVELD
jgi:hypothetical protein